MTPDPTTPLTHPPTAPPYLGPSRKKTFFDAFPKAQSISSPIAQGMKKKIITTITSGPGCTLENLCKLTTFIYILWVFSKYSNVF